MKFKVLVLIVGMLVFTSAEGQHIQKGAGENRSYVSIDYPPMSKYATIIDTVNMDGVVDCGIPFVGDYFLVEWNYGERPPSWWEVLGLFWKSRDRESTIRGWEVEFKKDSDIGHTEGILVSYLVTASNPEATFYSKSYKGLLRIDTIGGDVKIYLESMISEKWFNAKEYEEKKDMDTKSLIRRSNCESSLGSSMFMLDGSGLRSSSGNEWINGKCHRYERWYKNNVEIMQAEFDILLNRESK